MITTDQLQERIEAAWEGTAPLTDPTVSAAVAKAVYQRVQDCALLLALDQLGADGDQRRPAHRASMSAEVYSLQFETGPVDSTD